MFIDSHCHLDRMDLTEFDGSIANIIAQAHANGVEQMLCVSVTLNEFPDMVAKTRAFPQVLLSCGQHPLNQDDYVDQQRLLTLAKSDNVVAIGETGLDYYYAPETKAVQQDAFRKHLNVANQLQKPVIIHTRDACDDTLAIMQQEHAANCGGVLHCFTESWQMAQAALAMGFYISFSGIITFKNAAALREVVRKTPMDRLLIETDSPYLAPVPFRGKQNQPAYVTQVAKCVAEIKGLTVEQVAHDTNRNFATLFLD